MNPMLNSSRLRVMQILPSFGIGGAEQMAVHLMAGLAADHDVTAVGLYPGSAGLLEERLKNAGVGIHHLGKRRGLDLRMLPALHRVIGETQPHVVHTHLSVLRYALPVVRRCRVPLTVHTLHNTAERESDFAGQWIQRLAFRRTVVPIAISRDGATSFERVYGRKCPAMIPNSIPTEAYEKPAEIGRQWRAQEGLDSDAIVLTCVGRLEPQKNPLALVATFAALRNERAHLVLIGDGSLRTEVIDCIRANRVARQVHLLGVRPDVPDCLAGSDIFVLASNWEGNPLAVMEAMAAGLPVVSTSVGGVPELVEDGLEGILVAPGQPADLMSAMRVLVEDQDKRRAMGAAARERAHAMFGVNGMTARYAALYRSFLDASQRGSKAKHESWESGQTQIARAAGSKQL